MKKNISKTIFKTSLVLTISFVLSLVVSEEVHAQKKSQQKSKKMTVGDLLKKAQESSRGGQLKQMEKNDIAVPNSQFAFKPQPKQNLSSIKPPRSTEMLKFEKGNNQAEYERTLDRQIQELFKLTKKFENSPNRGELWLRLAELYVEKSALVDARKQDQYDTKLVAFQSGKTKEQPKLDQTESQGYNRRAIQLYEWFLRDYPNDPKVSQALFFLGYNYFELGENAKGSTYYDRLTKQYPKSPFVGEAHFALGEYYFEGEKWSDAYREYSFIIKDKKHRLHAFAFYKGGWCLYRMGRTDDGIKYLDFIVKSAKSSNVSAATKASISRSKLESEALRDLVVFYSDTGDTNRAVNYFRNLEIDEAAQNGYIEKLAYYFADKGNRDASRDVFRRLIVDDPTAKKSFEYQYQIVQNYFYAKNSPQFKEELYKWINDFKKDSTWYNANRNDQVLIESAYKLREQTLRNYIMQQHQTAQNSRAAYSRQTASDGYQLYFQEFSDSPQVADMHFFFGELLYDMNKFDEASTHYLWVAENAPQNKYADKAGQNLLLAIEKVLPNDNELKRKVGDSVEPVPYEPAVEKFLRSAKWYVNKFPKSEKNAEIKFRMGRLYYQTNHFAEAEVVFKDIVEKHPKTKYSEFSANLLLDIYNLKKDYVGLEKIGAELLANDSISSSQTGTDIRGVLERASFKKGQDLELEKKYLESAEQFKAFAAQNPKSELFSLAVFNAGVNYERAGRTPEAIENYKLTLASKDKNSANVKPKAEKLIAKLYQDAGQFEESARLFKKIANESPKDPLVTNYLFNAAVMYEAMGKNREAIATYNEYLEKAKKRSDKIDATFNLAELLRKSNSISLAIERYDEYVMITNNPVRKVEAYYWLAQLHKRLRRETLHNENKAKTLQAFNRLNSTQKSSVSKYVAQFKFIEAEKSFVEFKSVRIPADPSKQKKAVDQKLELVNRLNNQLSEIIKLDSAEEIISSLNLIGETNEHMGKAIINAPVPKGFNEEQLKQYRAGIQGIADPFIKKSEESYKLAVERAHDLDVYSAAYRNSLSKLQEKDPKSYYNGSEIPSDSRLIQWIGEK